MKYSCAWLSDYVDLPPTANELAARLTAAGFSVEHQETVGTDTVLDIEVTTNRVDAMCHFGLAREVATLYDRPLRSPAASLTEDPEPTAGAITLHLDHPDGARYAARIIRGVTVAPSPAWLVERLAALGLRSINNVVDVTNYVLWELGQPLHAFDLATLGGATIRVRRARAGEELVTLDGQKRALDPDVLVIADAERPIGLAGVMGGLETEVTATTRDVLLESAHFNPKAVRRGARKLGMHTDASHRFERGADPGACAAALDRAAHLLQELAGGRVLAGVADARFVPEQSWLLHGTLDLARLVRFLGVDVAAQQVECWLAGLGFELTPAGEGRYTVTVPTWRYYDCHPLRPSGEVWEADLFEEVARLHGLDAIPSTLPRLVGAEPPASVAVRRRRVVKSYLAASGFAEAINFAFHDPESAQALPCLRPGSPPLALANPVSDRYSVMRRSLSVGLVENGRFNQRRGAGSVRLFEVGAVFVERPGERFPQEIETVGLIAGGVVGSPWQGGRSLDFHDVKGVLETLAERFGRRLEARPAVLPGLLEGATAELSLDGRSAGYLGRLAEEGSFALFLAELELEALGEPPAAQRVTTPSRYPAIEADLTLNHPLEVSWAQLEVAIREGASPLLVAFELKDRYQGPGLRPGTVNSTLSFRYVAEDRSLTQEEVNHNQEALAARLAETLGATRS
ncbi:MAG TPA: phenylalanine--tRNA ligase subunit beta [Thermoanaerobaculia bacterium]|nr:phenylalanine--tRNA ligase subunit beta [Thermoanaerobaculia bacterium]